MNIGLQGRFGGGLGTACDVGGSLPVVEGEELEVAVLRSGHGGADDPPGGGGGATVLLLQGGGGVGDGIVVVGICEHDVNHVIGDETGLHEAGVALVIGSVGAGAGGGGDGGNPVCWRQDFCLEVCEGDAAVVVTVEVVEGVGVAGAEA